MNVRSNRSGNAGEAELQLIRPETAVVLPHPLHRQRSPPVTERASGVVFLISIDESVGNKILSHVRQCAIVYVFMPVLTVHVKDVRRRRRESRREWLQDAVRGQ